MARKIEHFRMNESMSRHVLLKQILQVMNTGFARTSVTINNASRFLLKCCGHLGGTSRAANNV